MFPYAQNGPVSEWGTWGVRWGVASQRRERGGHGACRGVAPEKNVDRNGVSRKREISMNHIFLLPCSSSSLSSPSMGMADPGGSLRLSDLLLLLLLLLEDVAGLRLVSAREPLTTVPPFFCCCRRAFTSSFPNWRFLSAAGDSLLPPSLRPDRAGVLPQPPAEETSGPADIFLSNGWGGEGGDTSNK